MRILRVFPRRTNATPNDDLVRFGPPDMFIPNVDEVHVSCVFTWDLPHAKWLRDCWAATGIKTLLGGPATGEAGSEFTPGKYLADGCVITSRGCHNKCWFCSVWRREGQLRELPITDGWNVMDDNLISCSEGHVRGVFDMLSRQTHRPVFTGGIEAAKIEMWQATGMRQIRTDRLYCAYDTPDDLKPLQDAGRMFEAVGFTRRHLYAYVLIGHPRDTIDAARERLQQTWDAGFMPYAMLWRDKDGKYDRTWRAFQREWVRPAIIRATMRTIAK